MIKNETVRIKITDVTAEGAGVGKYEGMAVFVRTAAYDLFIAFHCAFHRSVTDHVGDYLYTKYICCRHQAVHEFC